MSDDATSRTATKYAARAFLAARREGFSVAQATAIQREARAWATNNPTRALARLNAGWYTKKSSEARR